MCDPGSLFNTTFVGTERSELRTFSGSSMMVAREEVAMLSRSPRWLR